MGPAPSLPPCSPRGSKGCTVEEDFSGLEWEEERVGGAEGVAPVREGPTGEGQGVVDLLNQLVDQLLAMELFG